MAIAYVAQRANTGVITAIGNVSIPLTSPASISIGNTLFLLFNTQNNTSDVPPVAPFATVTDPRGNTWVAETFQTSSDLGANHGGTIQIYRCLVFNAYLPGDALTIPSTIAGLAGFFQVQEFSGVGYGPHAVFAAANKGLNATTSTALPVTVSATGQLVLLCGGVGSANVVTTDVDTLDGTWSGALRTSGAANIEVWESHKILTGFTSAVQTYNATWTSSGGDNTFAQIALVYDPVNPGGTPIAQQFPPQDNPNFPCPDSGFEPLPTSTATVPIDTGTAYQIEHGLPSYSFGTHFYSAVARYDDSQTAAQQHHVAYDLYQKGAEVPQDAITTLVFPLGLVTTGAGASVIGGGTALAALQTAGGSYVQFNTASANEFIDCQFDMTTGTANGSQYKLTDYLNSRVVRIGVRFAGWKDDSSTVEIPVGEGLQFVYKPALSNGVGLNTYEVEMGAWLTPDYQRAATQQLRWFGETNPMPPIPNATSYYGPSTGNGLAGSWFHAPPDAGTSWSYLDLLNLWVPGTGGIGSALLRIYGLAGADFSQTIVNIDLLELVVELAPERRLANAVQSVATTPQYAYSLLGPGQYSPGRASVVTLRSIINQTNAFTVSGSPNDYVLVAREALPASSSDYYPALATAPAAPKVGGVLPSALVRGLQYTSPMEAVGPSLAFNGYTQPRTMSPNQRPLSQRVVVDGVFASSATLLDQYELSYGALDTGNYLSAGSFFPVFKGMAPLAAQQVYASHSQTQRFYVGAGSTYDQVKIVCRPDPLTTANLTVSLVGPGTIVTITPAQALAGTSIGFGWFEVTVPSTPYTPVTTLIQTMTFASAATSGAPWFVSSVQALGPTYLLAFEPLAAVSALAVNSYAAVLECTMAAPVLALGTNTITMNPADKTICRASTYDVPNINISNSSTFDRLIVERSIDSGLTWTVALRVTDPGSNITLIDEECPWDVGGAIAVIYRVTGYRDSDRRSTSATTGAWGGFSANPGAAFGLSSNVAGYSVAYVPADPSQVTVTWNPLNPVTTVPLHGADYQYALRIPENRGLSVTVAVLVDNITYCCMPTVSQAVLYDDTVALYDDPIVAYDGGAEAGACAAAQTSSLNNYGELLSKGGGSMSPRPYERDILNVFNSSAIWELKLPGGHTRFVTAQVGAMAITPAAGLYMAELTLTDITPPSADPYDE